MISCIWYRRLALLQSWGRRCSDVAERRKRQSVWAIGTVSGRETDSFRFLRKPGSEGAGAVTPGIVPSFRTAGGTAAAADPARDSGAFPLLLVDEDRGFEERRELLSPRAEPEGEAALDPAFAACEFGWFGSMMEEVEVVDVGDNEESFGVKDTQIST